MHLRDIINEQPTDFSIIQADCAQFLCESQQHLAYRMLPRTYADIQRVKVRQQKRTDIVTQVFNEAFSDVHNLRQRSVIAQTYRPVPTETHEPFYVFPLNGYKYMYSKEVKDSSSEYNQMIAVMLEQFNDNDVATEITSDVVKYTYTNTMLVEGMRAGAEIIFYNIPSYYAVRCETYSDPQQLITYLY
jgi:hypothetical protein